MHDPRRYHRGRLGLNGWGQKLPKALTQVGSKALIDYALDGFSARGFRRSPVSLMKRRGKCPAMFRQPGKHLP